MIRKILRADGTAVYGDWKKHAVEVYDHGASKSLCWIDVDCEKFDFDLAWDHPLLLTSDWKRPLLKRWDSRTGELIETIEMPDRIGQLICNRSGSRIAYLPPKGFRLIDLNTKRELKIEHCYEYLPAASYSYERDELLVQMRRKGQLMFIDFDAFEARPVSLPVACTFNWIEYWPDSTGFTVIDSKKNVHAFSFDSDKPLWSTSLRKLAGKDHIGVGCHSGDGSLIAATVARYSSNDLIVLSRATGEVLAHHHDLAWEGAPFGAGEVLYEGDEVCKPTDWTLTCDLLTGKQKKIQLNAHFGK